MVIIIFKFLFVISSNTDQYTYVHNNAIYIDNVFAFTRGRINISCEGCTRF